MRKIIIEVGVNRAQDTDRLLAEYPDAEYYGFEPTLELYGPLVIRYSNNPRVNLFPLALSNFIGTARFNIAGHACWGCSSLYEFPKNIHEIWPNRPDFNVTHTYQVPVITMKMFLENFIEKDGKDYEIVYAWIDAQGSDVSILQGFGDRISKLKAGCIEVALSTELYEGTSNQISTAIGFIKSCGFNEFTVSPDNVGREANLAFKRNTSDWNPLEISYEFS